MTTTSLTTASLTTTSLDGTTTTELSRLTGETSDRPGDLRLVASQIRFEQRAFWRNRSRAFFSVGFPLVFLVVFNAINGSHRISELGGISYATWFVPGILAYGLIMATFMNIAVSTAIARDTGILKRIRGTALPPWVFLAGRIGSTLVTAAVLVGVTLALGVGAYGVTIPTSTLPGLVLTIVVGTICFTSLGLAITCVIPNADAAPAVVNLLVLPLTFISGIWMVLSGAPVWLDATAKVFPVRALAHGLQHAFDPATTGIGVEWGGIAVLTAWALGGLVVCLRWFRWEPKR
ncbi:MAG: ABC transporter permease [Actinobacteria bacterium]|nr:ABC transporter permease [Actinomycetota bacterium]